jgi:ABC-2 type transport system permease protein
MQNIWTITKREYKQYFASPVAYMIIFVILLILGILFYLDLQAAGAFQYVPGADSILAPLATMLVLLTPALTTRLLAEERRLGTIELLLTAPVRDWELVVGKWLGGLFLLLTIVLLSLIYPLALNQFVKPGIDQGPVLSGYLGMILMCSSLVAIGVFISSLFSNQIAAFVTTLGVMIFLWWIIGPISQVMGNVSGSVDLVNYLNFQGHFFDNMVRGIIDLKDIIYYVSLTALALFLSTVSVEVRRWG